MDRSLSYQTGFPVLSKFLFNFRILLKYGADVEVEDDNGFTPLFHAAKNSSLTNLLELFETGKAEPNHIAKDEKGGELVKKHQCKKATGVLMQKIFFRSTTLEIRW
jgi:ankyrin repeat protein